MGWLLPVTPSSMSKAIHPISQQQVAALLRPRPHDSHKGMFGSAVVAGGDNGMLGAALLAGRAALKLGAGIVHVGLLADDAPDVDLVQPELMLHPAAEALALPADVVAIGCGLGQGRTAQKLLHQALGLDCPLVLDADALNLLAKHADLQYDLRRRRRPSVITPHPAEAARLLGCSTAEVQSARSESAQRLAATLQCSVVLKGADSLCVTRAGKTFVNHTGNPGMSAPGMGDVLAGMLAAFIAQGMDTDDALLLAVHLHGAAGDALAQQQVAIGMTASEVTEAARRLLNQWTPQH